MAKKKGRDPTAESLAPRIEIVREIRKTRQEMNITQEELAEASGTKKSNISRLESGRYNPSLDFLVKVAEGLGRTIEIQLK